MKGASYPGGQLQVGMTYDDQNRLTSVDGYVTISYGPGNDPSLYVYGNGMAQNFTYNALGQPKVYGLDAVGNVGARGYDGETYSYNGMDELTGASGSWLTATYSYDGAGNIMSATQDGVTTAYHYASSGYFDELTSTKTGTATTTYAYDGDGNMITRNSTQFEYNFLDEMTEAKNSSGVVETNEYDGLGMRYSRTVGGVTTYFAYMGDQVLYESNSTATTDFVYAGAKMVAEVVQGVGTYYTVQDMVGSVAQTTNSGGATTFAANYLPWGTIDVQTAGSQPLRYTDAVHDAAIGLYLFGSRFYDASIGRFVQADSSGGVVTDPLSLNRYAYAGDNPMTFIDPTGHSWTNPLTWGSDATNWWSGLSPTQQAAVVTTVILVACVVTLGTAIPIVGVTTAGILGTSVGLAVDGTLTGVTAGAMAGTVIYDAFGVVTGRQVTVSGILTAAFVGAVTGGITGGAASLAGILVPSYASVTASMAAQGAASLAGAFAYKALTNDLGGTRSDTSVCAVRSTVSDATGASFGTVAGTLDGLGPGWVSDLLGSLGNQAVQAGCG